MKLNKIFSIDLEMYELLKKEDNASKIINDLLLKHYKDYNKTDKQIIEEVKNMIKERESKEFIKKARTKASKEI